MCIRDSLWGRLQHQIHAAGQDDDVSAMVDEFGDVGNLNPGDMACMGLAPIPRASTAGPQFHVLPCPEAMDLHDSPRQMLNSGRCGMFGHGAISLRLSLIHISEPTRLGM